MRVVVLTRSNTDYARAIETFVTDFARQTGKTLEVLDADTRAAESLARTYDIMEYPTIIALSDDGQMQNMWRGATLPTISEVSYYAS
mgnify:CR=1 FL=1